MCYKCARCDAVQAHGTKLRRYIKYRTSKVTKGQEIESEWPVCANCYIKLTGNIHSMDANDYERITWNVQVKSQQLDEKTAKAFRNIPTNLHKITK